MTSDVKLKVTSFLLWFAIGCALFAVMRGAEGSYAALVCLALAFITWLKRRDLLRQQRN